MFYGVQITSGIQDWQVFQRHDRMARITVKGIWRLNDGARKNGVSSATPLLRAANEADQTLVLPWTPCDTQTGCENLDAEDVRGEWAMTFTLPQGGPYRIETCLDAVSRANGDHWMFRGDIRVHVGVGDVFCMAGQSNAAGYAKGTAFDPPDPRVHLLRNSGRWDMAAHPMNDATDAADCPNAPMGITGTSPFLSFGRRYADYTGLPVGLIAAAQGGSPMKSWDNAREGGLYRNMIEKLGPGCDVRAIVWYQGCSDADPENAAVYSESFARMVRDTRESAGWCVPFFTVQLNKYEWQSDAASWAKIKESQRQAAESLEKVWLMPASMLLMSDEIHNSAAGNVTLGEMLARQAHAELNGGPAYAAPALDGIARKDGKIVLAFRNTQGFFRLRPKHDAGDFSLTDNEGQAALSDVAAAENTLVLTPARPLSGPAFLSYGVNPMGPEGSIVDQATYLPIICFDHVEVPQ